ncbi:hypothetical protein BRD00_09010 [Halobacteriales archaeon QS_8_69_26]|nr:MAG: hypothetical protein BRD00_09010 [Halobacteriales archaeon QS_8_69_26]
MLDRIQRTDREYREAAEAVESVGEDRIATVAEAHRKATTILDRYDGRATGTGDFKAFVQFQQEFSTLVEGLDDDLPRKDAFEEAQELLDKRRVSEGDFEQAREAVAPAGDLAERIDDREAARDRYRDARRAVRDRVGELDREIARLERVQELGEADLDAPTERLREPIEAYNDAVRDAFRTFRREASAREVLSFGVATRQYPLVEFRQPPEELLRYVRDRAAGEEPIPTLLEYADYSRSKLSHYVDDAGELKRRIATRQTYLERLDADPLTVDWPPPEAEELAFLGRELVSACARFAPDPVVERARRVRRLPADPEYDRLRDAAVATEQLDAADRRRIESGRLEAELGEFREARESLRDALEEYPER